MRCPECGSKLRTLDTREVLNNVVRIRKCSVCSEKFTTIERAKINGEQAKTLSGRRHSSTE